MNIDSIFTKIRKQEIPGIIFDDNGEFFVIHTNHPAQLGHLLIIPYQETDYIFDLDIHTYHRLWDYVRYIAVRLQHITGAKKIAIKVEGLEIAHTHIHLIPIYQAGDMDAMIDFNPADVLELKKKFMQ